MKTLRDYLNLLETPVNDFQLHGDFEQDGSLIGKDRKLLGAPKHEQRIRKLVTKTPFILNVHILNLGENDYGLTPNKSGSILKGFQYSGQYSKSQMKEYFDIDCATHPDQITFVLAGNNNGEQSLSAWMVIHRLMHGIEDACSGFVKFKADEKVKQTFTDFERLVTQFGLEKFINRYMSTKSATKLSSQGECFAELMVQYLSKGKVILNHVDEDGIQDLEDNINDILFKLFSNCCGKIFVMF